MIEKSQKILRINNFSNLDICNPEVLFDISRLFDGEPSELFPRLKPLVATNQFREKQARLEIRTLGEFRIFTDGKEIPINRMISQKRVMDLLKLLIIFRKNGVVKEMVYEPFWPKYSLKNARDNLNTIFYRLRNILGKDNDFFIANSTTISFREDVLDTDVDRFLEFISLGEDSERRGEIGEAIDMFSHAVDTYGGDFLLGDLYSDFIRDERHLLQRKYINTLFHLSKLYLSAGDYLQALNNLKALLEIDPVCEPAVRLLMIGSALVGSRNSIPQIFDELRVKLMDSFSLEPDEITLRLKDTLLSGKRAESSMWENEVVV
jgi:DNA-binding SARP family transcriptional activator